MPDASAAPREARRKPKHIAFIMDGSARWASERGLPARKFRNMIYDFCIIILFFSAA